MSEVRIRIAVDGTCIEFEGSRACFDRSIAPLLEALAGPSPGQREAEATRSPEGPAWTPQSPQHFVQFTAQVGARAATPDQRIMAFAFYLWNFEKAEVFRRPQVEAFFRTLQEEPPEDLSDRVRDLTQTKRFLEADGRDAWRLSTKGVNYVKNRLLA